MTQRRKFLITAFAFAGACAALPGRAAPPLQFEGLSFDTTLRLADAELVLNGVGVRAVAWFKGYAAALYLPGRATTTAQVLAGAGPKRLQLRMLQDVPAAEFVKAIDKGFARNTPAAQQPALAERRQRFDAQVQALGEVKKGDVVDLDFVPGRGLVFTHNGQSRGETIAGDDFYAALLLIFIGEHPVDGRLKAGLLGGRGP